MRMLTTISIPYRGASSARWPVWLDGDCQRAQSCGRGVDQARVLGRDDRRRWAVAGAPGRRPWRLRHSCCFELPELGVFVAGDMLDWEAPTGGYLLTASMASAAAAARGAVKRLGL
jgi:hypothetical protein